jgi:hypothetical protein
MSEKKQMRKNLPINQLGKSRSPWTTLLPTPIKGDGQSASRYQSMPTAHRDLRRVTWITMKLLTTALLALPTLI